MGAAFDGYAAAIQGFAGILDAPEFLRIATQRARSIPGVRDPHVVAQSLVAQLPGWIAELHFDRVRRCLSAQDYVPAVWHWRILELAARFPGLAGPVLLEQRRRILLESAVNAAILEKDDLERAQEIANAERLIARFSPLEIPAREFALRAYSIEFGRNLKRLYPPRYRKCEDLPVNPPKQLKPDQARKLRSRLVRYAKPLRRHALVLGRCGPQFQNDVVHGLVLLAQFYLLTGDHALGSRMVRRARRLDPGNAQVHAVAAWIRRAGRR